MTKRYFEMKDGLINKFCYIHIVLDIDYDEFKYVVNIGHDREIDQTYELEFSSKEECEKEALKYIEEKFKEGYIESKEVDLYYFMGVSPDEVKIDEKLFSIESIEEIEKELGYKIPQMYIDLMKIKNGDEQSRKIGNQILDMTGFIGIDSLFDMKDSTEDWGYPPIGIYFSWTQSAGHEALLMNYEECLSEGEPSIWILDQELEQGVFLASNFSEFIKQLYFEDFSTRYDKVLKNYYSEHYNDNEGEIIKYFLDDWGFNYEG